MKFYTAVYLGKMYVFIVFGGVSLVLFYRVEVIVWLIFLCVLLRCIFEWIKGKLYGDDVFWKM